MRGGQALLLCSLAIALPARSAHADLTKFEIDGRIYTKHLYQNDDNQGLNTLGNPFWPDNLSGHNGVGSELELSIRGHVSQYVETGARIASRFGERWQDWWESGNSLSGGVENTSGDSAGMNRASYMKLRGTYIQASPEVFGIDWVRAGSSDFSQFNAWTIGKIRYIDRDNGRGYFASGHVGSADDIQWHVGIIAMPKLFVGPSWSTGLGDPNVAQAFWSRDWAYAASLRWRVSDKLTVRAVADFTQDLEVNKADPDAVGSSNPTCKDKLGNAIPSCAPNHAVDFFTRYASLNATFDFESEPMENVRLVGLVGYSQQQIDPNLVGNGVELNQGVFPMIFKDTHDFAGTLRLSIDEIGDTGLTFQGEYFNIGAEWNAIFGARRESDVLLTDGLIGSGGQLPTLNLANEFVDFNDDWVESCIGWTGGTGVLNWHGGDTSVKGEYTYLGYNTNTGGNERDVQHIYPTFLHNDGFTDTALYDYANTSDRGRDPRAVYHRFQDRTTQIAMLDGKQLFNVGRGLELDVKAKYISDIDYRAHHSPTGGEGSYDDYHGNIFIGRAKLSLPVADGVKVAVIGQLDHWDEVHRRGTWEGGYGNDVTDKRTAAFSTQILFGGMKVNYYLEYINKDQDRERDGPQHWDVWRSKATVEANW